MKKSVLVYLIAHLVLTSCLAQEAGTHYEECMDRYLLSGGIDFYEEMSLVEKSLIESNVLKGSDRMGYLEAFDNLFNDTDFSSVYEDIQDSMLSDFSLGHVALQLFSHCSEINLNKPESNCSCLNIHKNILKKFIFKPYDDDELLDDLFIFTDFDDNILRMHVTFLLILNMEMKYGNK